MKKHLKITFACLLTLTTAMSTAAFAATPHTQTSETTVSNTTNHGYALRSGDELQITVFNHPELSSPVTGAQSQYVIRPDGHLSFPLLGTINVAGLTVEQLQNQLTSDFSRYIKNPNVSINIKKLGTTRVYVLGEINRPGLFELTNSHRAIDAISAAGGFTDKSAKKKVYLIRRGSNTPVLLNINNFLLKGDQSQNPVLNDGDTIYFTRNGKIDIVRDVLPFISSAYYVTRFNKD